MTFSGPQEQLLFGDMELERELGTGGMGKVHLRRSKRTGERFAVKWTHFRAWAGQRNFLLELMTWYGLPRHPHLVECRFFRTLQNDQTGESEIVIFAEYVPGGSLAEWIASRKLTRLDQILDVAIQFAWGLHAAHELDVVHQDVKPGNVMLTSDGVVKVADFGLARARARAGETASDQSAQSMLVSSGGMTLAYCSPEQFASDRLTRKTDIWSWAVSVLDMFTGQPNTSIGARAHRGVFKEYWANGSENPWLLNMPASLVEVLRKCFRRGVKSQLQSRRGCKTSLGVRYPRRFRGRRKRQSADPDEQKRQHRQHVPHVVAERGLRADEREQNEGGRKQHQLVAPGW